MITHQINPLIVLPCYYVFTRYVTDSLLYLFTQALNEERFGADNIKSIFEAVRAGLDVAIGAVIFIYGLMVIKRLYDKGKEKTDP